MYDLKPFNSPVRHFISWLDCHPAFTTVLVAILFVAATLITKNFGILIFALPALFILAIFSGEADYHTVGGVFARKNNLDKFFMKHGDNYQFIYDEYRSMIHSSFLKHELTVWSMPVGGAEFATVFTPDGGCLCWMPLDRAFPHLIIDSVQDNPLIGRQWSKKALPPEKIQLEGNFSHSFHVYQEVNEQIMTLQILSPDRMATLLDEFPAANLEIQDKFLRIYIAGVQKNSTTFEKFLNTLATVEQELKVPELNKIL